MSVNEEAGIEVFFRARLGEQIVARACGSAGPKVFAWLRRAA